jgi:hypothetical protein
MPNEKLTRSGPPGAAIGCSDGLEVFYFLNIFIVCQDVFPGKRHSQKIQPLTMLPVIETAAAEGESKRFPFSTREPDSTFANIV